MRIKKIKTKYEYILFSELFASEIGYSIPVSYFMFKNVWGLFDDQGKLQGGFAIINQPAPRCLKQIPNPKTVLTHFNKLSEFTGYFIRSKKGSIRLTIRMVIETFKNPKNEFIYAYDLDDLKLRKYYGAGKPRLLYEGIPKKLPGHPENMKPERIEVLTKIGVLRIFLYRTFKILLKVLRM